MVKKEYITIKELNENIKEEFLIPASEDGEYLSGDFYKSARKEAPTVFTMHGLGSARVKAHMQKSVEVFYNWGFNVVNMDASNSGIENGNRSGGYYKDITLNSHYSSLKRGINWTKERDWFNPDQGLVTSTHSLGSMAALKYAQDYPEDLRFVVAMSPVISGFDFKNAEDIYFDTWREDVPAAFMRNLCGHDLMEDVDKIKCSVHIIIGEYDEVALPSCARAFYNALNCEPRSYWEIKGCSHQVKDDLDGIEKVLNNALTVQLGNSPKI